MLHRSKSHAIGTAAGAFVMLVVGLGMSGSSRAQSPASQKELFEKRCGGCHALDRDKEGPQLNGVYGRKAGSVGSFHYSDALKKSKIVWTEEALEHWLTDPDKLVPDNDMPFHVEKADERRAIIAYLKHASGK